MRRVWGWFTNLFALAFTLWLAVTVVATLIYFGWALLLLIPFLGLFAWMLLDKNYGG